MHRPARPSALALRIERIGNGKRVGIEFDDRVDRWSVLVECIDPRQVLLGDRPGSVLAGVHPVLELIHRCFGQREIVGARVRRVSRGLVRPTPTR